MPDVAFDLRYLHYAYLVAEHGSFRRAADCLDVSQSTLSRRIQLLERRLGVALFERSRKGVKPTLLGERFLRNAAVGAQHLRHAIGEMTLAKRGDAGEVRIGLVSSLAQGILGDVIEAYHRRYPNVDVKLCEASSQENAIGVLNGRIDVAFIAGEPRLPGCETRHLWNEELFVVLPAGHGLVARENISWADLRDEHFIVADDVHGPEVEGIIVRNVSALGFQPKISAHRLGRENIINMVAKGYGVTLAGSSTLGVSYPGVEFCRIGSESDLVSWSAVWSSKNTSPLLRPLLELAAVIAERRS